ncbi:hypothetical protein FQ192_22145 [Pseudomonas sp. ANT_J12]|uniref:hypothetical protein n=1 Tax=Pseudomonas sp. ANT_J12 TaxID=2597351 RepID=UPI0011F1CD4F|nr:hypothetical protein [Pseudomonas sp. ANT_J12]KAA0987333.1 hypothetical protein FQ192_22145 [Pseudomonas sp. ANT_J12]
MNSTLDVVRAQMQEAEPVLKQLDVALEAINFDPFIPSSVDAAIERGTAVIDTLLVNFRANPILSPLADQLKTQYLDAFHHQVDSAQGG